MRLDRVARAKVGDPIGPHDLPVGAREYAPVEPWALDPAAENVDHPAFAIRCVPEMSDICELRVDGENGCLRYHGLLPLGWRVQPHFCAI